MNVLLIGHGSIGKRHRRNLTHLGHHVVTCDTVERGVSYDDLHRALQSETIDAAVVATPARAHTDQLIALGAYNIPTLVEKPLADSLTAAQEAVANQYVQVGYNWRYHHHILEFRYAVATLDSALGVLGDSYLHFTCNTSLADWPGKDYTYPLLECSHEIDLLRWMRGGPIALESCVQRRQTSVSLKFDTGDVVDIDWAAPAKRTVILRHKDGNTLFGCVPSLGGLLDASYIAEMADFLTRIAEKRSSPCSLADGMAVLKICEEAKEMLA